MLLGIIWPLSTLWFETIKIPHIFGISQFYGSRHIHDQSITIFHRHVTGKTQASFRIIHGLITVQV